MPQFDDNLPELRAPGGVEHPRLRHRAGAVTGTEEEHVVAPLGEPTRKPINDRFGAAVLRRRHGQPRWCYQADPHTSSRSKPAAPATPPCPASGSYPDPWLLPLKVAMMHSREQAREMNPLPHVSPMLATAGTLPERGRYATEMKWDGVRAVAYWDGAELRLLSRNDNDITAGYPELAALGGSTRLDGSDPRRRDRRLRQHRQAVVRDVAGTHACARRQGGPTCTRRASHLPVV